MSRCPSPARPLTSRAKSAIEAADESTAKLSDEFVGTEHVLLGLLADSQSLAAQILAYHGVNEDAVRAHIRHARRPSVG